MSSKPQQRKSLIATGKPKYGRFDLYEPIGEQLAYDAETLSSFDFIFALTDQPREKADRNLARHMIESNYAGELHVHDDNRLTDIGEELDEATREFKSPIDRDLLRAYIAYARSNCFPVMTKPAKEVIEDFYVDLRRKGQDEDTPVIATADEIDTLVRIAEASARLRLSDTVDEADAERAVEIVHYGLRQIGIDPEAGEFNADVVETGTSKSQRDRIQNVKGIIADIEDEYDEGAPIDVVVERAEEVGIDESKAEHEIEKLKQRGKVYEPRTDHLRSNYT